MVGESEVESVGASILYKTCSPRIGCGRCGVLQQDVESCRSGVSNAACFNWRPRRGRVLFGVFCRGFVFVHLLKPPPWLQARALRREAGAPVRAGGNGRRSGSRGAFCKPPASSVGPSDTFFAPICLPVSLSVFSFSCASATLWNVLNARFHAVVYDPAQPTTY